MCGSSSPHLNSWWRYSHKAHGASTESRRYRDLDWWCIAGSFFVFKYFGERQSCKVGVLSQSISALVSETKWGSLFLAYSLAHSSFNPGVPGSIPSSEGLRKFYWRWYTCVNLDFGYKVQLYHWRHAKVVTFGGSGGIRSMESMGSPGSWVRPIEKLLQSDPSSSSDFRFDGCPVTSNRKSDEEDGSLWRSSSPMTDETVRSVLNQPWFCLKEIYFQHFINQPDESVQ